MLSVLVASTPPILFAVLAHPSNPPRREKPNKSNQFKFRLFANHLTRPSNHERSKRLLAFSVRHQKSTFTPNTYTQFTARKCRNISLDHLACPKNFEKRN